MRIKIEFDRERRSEGDNYSVQEREYSGVCGDKEENKDEGGARLRTRTR